MATAVGGGTTMMVLMQTVYNGTTQSSSGTYFSGANPTGDTQFTLNINTTGTPTLNNGADCGAKARIIRSAKSNGNRDHKIDIQRARASCKSESPPARSQRGKLRISSSRSDQKLTICSSSRYMDAIRTLAEQDSKRRQDRASCAAAWNCHGDGEINIQ